MSTELMSAGAYQIKRKKGIDSIFTDKVGTW